jgi:tetratricopeptide (TPR) repeat protein
MTTFERDLVTWSEGGREESYRAARRLFDEKPEAMGYYLSYRALRANYLEDAQRGVEALDLTADGCYADWVPAWGMAADVYHLRDLPDEALAAARALVEAFPREASSHRRAAVAHLLGGDAAGAREAVASLVALPLDPGVIVGQLVDIGREFEVHGAAAEAREVYEDAWRRVEARPEAFSMGVRAEAAYHALSPEDALGLVREARDSLPTNSNHMGQLAITLDRVGRTEEAEALAAAIPANNPTSAWPGLFHARRGDADRAVEALRRVLDAGRIYQNVGNLFLHSAPELLPVADDPAFQNLMRPKVQN